MRLSQTAWHAQDCAILNWVERVSEKGEDASFFSRCKVLSENEDGERSMGHEKI